MNGKHFTFLAGALLMFAACSEDVSELGQTGSANDPLADYDGPLNVSIQFGNTTRTSTVFENGGYDAYVGNHPYPVTTFNPKDTVGIVQVSTSTKGVSQVFNFMAVTSDGGATWTVKDVNGQNAMVRHFIGRENTYFAYSPYVSGGLNDAADFLLSSLPSVDMTKFNEYCDSIGVENVPTPACSFFEPLIDRVLETHKDQSQWANFNACDLIGARGVCTTDESARTATLSFSMNHLLALDILALKKWDGRLTIYGTYDTWVAPDKTIWRMKQQMKPTVVSANVAEPMFPNVGKIEANTQPVVDLDGNPLGGYAPAFEGLGNWYHDTTVGADTCRFYLQLVKCCVPRNQYGYANSAAAGGWLVDIPPVPAGHYVVVGNPYFRFFREKNFTPREENTAGTTWRQTWKEYYSNRPYTWTYEDILFPNVAELYDYDHVLEVGDQLLANGNIAKANTGQTGVGTVKWIAYAPKPWLNMSSTYQKWNQYYFINNFVVYSEAVGTIWESTYELRIPEAFADNGYRPYGKSIETNGVKHLSIDYAANGCSSLDDFWCTDVCNHFMAFYNNEVTYKTNSDDIRHDDQIFSLALPSISINGEKGLTYYKLASGAFCEGYHPYTWAYMTPDWYLNKDHVSGIRSNKPAESANGPGVLGTSSWMIPTVIQYYMANYLFDNRYYEKNLLSCNYVPGTSGHDKEGLVVLNGSYGFSASPTKEQPVYFGDGNIDLFTEPNQAYNSANWPIRGLFNYSALPISGVDSAAGVLDGSVVMKEVSKDKLYIYNDNNSPIVGVPTEYTPCIIY